MKNMSKYKVWLNLAAAVAVFLILIYVANKFLAWHTSNGERIEMPKLYGLQFEEALALAEGMDLRVKLLDSVYDDQLPPGVVVTQIPDTGEFVKSNRLIYLTLNSSQTPEAIMPALVDINIKQAMIMLRGVGLKLGRVDTTDDIAQGAVIQQLFNGREVLPGKILPRGSTIDLVIASGRNPAGVNSIPLPDFKGMTYQEAIITAEAYGLRIGNVVTEGNLKDSLNAVVKSQSPAFVEGLFIQSGTSIDLVIK